ncbi:MAG: PepSY-like domain-containing protein [Rikenellaceae bacterium]
MKKTLMAVVVALLTTTLWAQKPTEPELRTEIKQFLSTYFPNDKAVSHKVDMKGLEIEGFDITLESGTELDFDRDGNWEKIDMKKGSVPVKVLPKNVLNLLTKTGIQNNVQEIDKEDDGSYEVTLKNGKEIKIK